MYACYKDIVSSNILSILRLLLQVKAILFLDDLTNKTCMYACYKDIVSSNILSILRLLLQVKISLSIYMYMYTCA